MTVRVIDDVPIRVPRGCAFTGSGPDRRRPVSLLTGRDRPGRAGGNTRGSSQSEYRAVLHEPEEKDARRLRSLWGGGGTARRARIGHLSRVWAVPAGDRPPRGADTEAGTPGRRTVPAGEPIVSRDRRETRPEITVSPSGPGRVVELEIWSGCQELIVEGAIDSRTIGEFQDCLRRIVDSDHDLVLVDLDRCDFLDVAAVKQLVVARELLSCRRCEMLVFAPEGQARGLLQRVGAFD